MLNGRVYASNKYVIIVFVDPRFSKGLNYIAQTFDTRCASMAVVLTVKPTWRKVTRKNSHLDWEYEM